MHTSTKKNELEERINALVDEKLFQAFWDASTHFKSTDLVLFFDDTEPIHPVSAYVRTKLLLADDLDEDLRKKISKPAREACFKLTPSETVFWLAVQFVDGERACVAVNAKRIMPGGHA